MRMTITALALAASLPLIAAEENVAEKHRTGSEELAELQDNLSADVQQLVIEQTQPKVIELLGEVEDIMDEATDLLAEADTGGNTIAAQTEIIEKIHEAAKERQKKSGGSGSGGAMMDMMERMMGKDPGDQKGKGKGKGNSGEQGGEGKGGDSDSANDAELSAGKGNREQRRVPKAAGTAGIAIPEEFRKAFDAYNRGLESSVK